MSGTASVCAAGDGVASELWKKVKLKRGGREHDAASQFLAADAGGI